MRISDWSSDVCSSDLDAEHEIEGAQSTLQALAVGCGQYRIAGAGDQRADAAVAGGVDFLGQCRHRQFTGKLGQATYPAVPACVVAAGGSGPGDRHGSVIDQRSAFAIEIAGLHIDQLDQPQIGNATCWDRGSTYV